MAKETKIKKEEILSVPEIKEGEKYYDLREVAKEIPIQEVTPIELLAEKEVVELAQKYEAPKPVYRKELDSALSFEERIEAFLESRGQNYIQINDFLKSLYGVPRFNEPPKWANLSSMKQLVGVLSKMQSEGKISIKNDRHKQLGKHYYSGVDQKQCHHNLSTVIIEAKK